MIEPAFFQILVNNTAVAAIAADRVYFNIRPQDEHRPTLVITRITGNAGRTFSQPPSYLKGIIQLDCFANTYRSAKELAAAARQTLDNYTGTVAGTLIDLIEVEDERDVPSLPLAGSATPIFGVSLDCRFLHEA